MSGIRTRDTARAVTIVAAASDAPVVEVLFADGGKLCCPLQYLEGDAAEMAVAIAAVPQMPRLDLMLGRALAARARGRF